MWNVDRSNYYSVLGHLLLIVEDVMSCLNILWNPFINIDSVRFESLEKANGLLRVALVYNRILPAVSVFCLQSA